MKRRTTPAHIAITKEDALPVVRELSNYLKKRYSEDVSVMFSPIGTGAHKVATAYERAFRDEAINYVRVDLEQEKHYDEHGEYRPVKIPFKNAPGIRAFAPKVVAVIDENVHWGFSYRGHIKAFVDWSEFLGIEEIIPIIDVDQRGVAPFSRKKVYDLSSFPGVLDDIANYAPYLYQDLFVDANGVTDEKRTNLICQYIPEEVLIARGVLAPKIDLKPLLPKVREVKNGGDSLHVRNVRRRK